MTNTRLKYSTPAAAAARRWYTFRTRDVARWLFVATTGRSGTLTLVDIFRHLPGCVALHEPYPAMHGRVLREASAGNREFVDRIYRQRKSVNIRRQALGANVYLEANHLFIKTFADQALEDFGKRLGVIHLVRNPLGVAHSIYRLQDQPGTTEGNRWWLDYRAPTNSINLARELDDDPEFSHPFYKGLWYWFEIEQRVARWRARHPAVPITTFHTEDLGSREALSGLFETLSLPVTSDQLTAMSNKRSHQRTHQKHGAPLADTEQRDMLAKFTGLLSGHGLELPPSLDHYAIA